MQRTAVSVPSPVVGKIHHVPPTIAQADEKRGRGTLSTGALNPSCIMILSFPSCTKGGLLVSMSIPPKFCRISSYYNIAETG